ncbi:MAG: type II toxin-antitoxin system RelE/ParE family toxin [Selenomonadaceae bacterium]|nr:type II toxin-antitoxin system RelE/ParE family toxin [Selenomonadaceae bacterium]
MTYKVLETVAATKDLDNIIGYITGKLYNFTAAKDFADEVEQCYKKLSVIPFMYELCQDERLKRLGYRKVVIKNYIMVYRIDNDRRLVYVMRFFYGKQNYADLL